MERHPTDFVELLFGLAFLAAGGAFIVRQTTDRSFDGAWIAAIALVTIGSAFLAVTVLRRPRPELGNERPIEVPIEVPVDEPVEEVRP
ncbi:MAG: hypothetical protein QOJ71_1562 [Actinomycetota bacterium]|nr:hypothetical protein [Actinomycetota bacterium]